MMRVLQFGRFWNAQHGGLERHVFLLSQGLAQQGVEVVNLVAAVGRAGMDDIDGKYRLVQAPSFGKLFGTALSPALLRTAMALHREKAFDLFHLHFPDPLSHLGSMMLPAEVPRVITWHSDIVRQKKLLAVYQPFLRRITRQADALVAATPAHFDSSIQIPADVPPTRKHVIPYGLDYSLLQLDARTSALCAQLRSRAQGRGLVFALGRHVYYKGFDVLLEALQHTQAFLILGGDGPLKADLERQAAALGVKGRVFFAGRIPEEDLAAYFHACDVFCMPSVEPAEAFGLVQLEAMACGKPVICTQLNNGVNAVNVDGQTGFAVPVRDAVALGVCIERLLNDENLRASMGQQALKNSELYSVPAMVASHIRLYQELLKTRR